MSFLFCLDPNGSPPQSSIIGRLQRKEGSTSLALTAKIRNSLISASTGLEYCCQSASVQDGNTASDKCSLLLPHASTSSSGASRLQQLQASAKFWLAPSSDGICVHAEGKPNEHIRRARVLQCFCDTFSPSDLFSCLPDVETRLDNACPGWSKSQDRSI